MCEFCEKNGITQFWSRTTLPNRIVGCDICTDRWDFDDLLDKWEDNGFPYNGNAFTCPVCGTERATVLYIDRNDKIVGCNRCIDEEVVQYDDGVEIYPDCWRREDAIIDRALDDRKEGR